MGSGSAPRRAVAELVLMDGRFATLPAVMAEGPPGDRASIERVAKIFVTRERSTPPSAPTAVGLARLCLPRSCPRHLTASSPA